MAFMCYLCGVVQFLWCTLMPICGTLYLISTRHREQNKSRSDLLKHWCYYWAAFFLLRLLVGFLSFLPAGVCSLLCYAKVIMLSVLATPKLNITVRLFEFLQEKAGLLTDVKDWIYQKVIESISGSKK